MINTTTIYLLTPREKECATWLILGKTAEETAAILGLSRRTVEDHLAAMKAKLGCSNKVQLAVLLLSHGLDVKKASLTNKASVD